jgi:hypothetical protein
LEVNSLVGAGEAGQLPLSQALIYKELIMLAASTPSQLCAWAALVSAVALTALWIRSAFVFAILWAM